MGRKDFGQIFSQYQYEEDVVQEELGLHLKLVTSLGNMQEYNTGCK